MAGNTRRLWLASGSIMAALALTACGVTVTAVNVTVTANPTPTVQETGNRVAR